MNNLNRLIAALALFVFFINPVLSADDINAGQKYWLFFSDKGQTGFEKRAEISQVLKQNATERNLERRRLVRAESELFDYTDLPLSAAYLNEIRTYDLEIKRHSKWLNAVSVVADEAVVEQLQQLDFIDSIRPVAVYTRPNTEYFETGNIPQKPAVPSALDYGPSFTQVDLVNVPILHSQGLTGEGVLIGVFDTGFDTDHLSLGMPDIVYTYDYINDDTDVRDGFDSQRSHGTAVLAVMAGYNPGELIGPAYGASFFLAKTEDVSSETQVEEDNFIAALETADSLGCQIVSASVGYIDWYTPEDLDGNTAYVTIASDLAVSKGITMVVAAGNEGPGATSIIAPADGDDVIAVGGVFSNGTVTTSSSRGPTADGRIKPDICALYWNVYVADYSGDYKYSAGTSFATPMVAGAIALMIENDPSLTPTRIREAIWNTGQRQAELQYPNNDYGYGVLDAAAASGYALPDTESDILAYPNPFEDIIYVSVKISEPGTIRSSIHTLDGIKIWERSINSVSEQEIIAWNGRNSHNQEVAAGIYIFQVSGPGLDGMTKLFKVK